MTLAHPTSAADSDDGDGIVALRRVVGGFGLALLAATWPLWWSVEGPRIPVSSLLLSIPATIDRLFVGMLIAGLGGLLLKARSQAVVRIASLAVALSAVALVFLDQQRFQPWLYHVSLLAAFLGCNRGSANLLEARWLAVSIYLYSAWSRIDITFLDTIGREFLETLLSFAHCSMANWSDSSRRIAALSFPLGEFLTGAMLAWPRARKVGLAASTVLHLSLIAILGPLGLNHRPAVLLWNALFLTQNWLVFRRPADRDAIGTANSETEVRRIGARLPASTALLAAVVAWPLLEPMGLCDHWPAWGLYSPRSSRIVFEVSASAVDRLGDDWHGYLEPIGESPWRLVSLDRWSLDFYRAPLYPQDRVQIGIAEYLARQYELGHLARVERLGPADRLSAERMRETMVGMPGIVAARNRFVLNSHPRATRPAKFTPDNRSD